MNGRSSKAFRLALLLVLLVLCSLAAGQAVFHPNKPAPGLLGAPAKRLILKDGNYQLASQWEIRGDRVRYLSSERGDWEEVPASLVDWNATDNFNKDRDMQRSLATRRAQQEEEAEWDLEAAPTVAPGLQLPSSGGVYLLDGYQGQPQLAELAQQSGDVNQRVGRNILRAAINPLASAKQSLELKGEHARIQSHSQQPSIYMNVDEPDLAAEPLPLAERFRIARLDMKKDARVISTVKVGLTGKVTQQESFIPATVEKMPADWVKLTPAQPLSSGEYAIVEMLGPKDVNMYVWDFGVNRLAPENPGVLRASPPAGPPGAERSPELRKR